MLLQYFTINNNPNKFITSSIYVKTQFLLFYAS